jgi:capsid protein
VRGTTDRIAPERHHELRPARIAAHAGEAVLEQPTVEEAANRATRRRAQRTVRRLEALFVHALERGEVIGQHTVQRRDPRAPRQVGR